MVGVTTDGLSRWLQTWPDERLVDLVARRLGRASRLPSSFDELGALLSGVESCEQALRQLDRSAVQAVALVAEAGGCLTVPELAARLQRPDALVSRALERASGVALAWPAGDGWHTPPGMARLAWSLLGRGLPYCDLLPEVPLAVLRQLMAAHDLGAARASWDAVDVLCQELPGRVAGLLEEGPVEVVDALTALVLGHGWSSGPEQAEQQGLVLCIGAGWFVPSEVVGALRGNRAVLRVEDAPKRVGAAAAAPPVQAVLRLLGRARELLASLSPPPRALAAGGLGVQVLRRLAKTVSEPLEDVVLLLQVLAAAGLVGSGLQAGTVTPAGRRWLQLSEEQAYVRLVSPQLHPRAVLEPPGSSPSGLLQGVARSGYGVPTVRQLAEASAARGGESDDSLVEWFDWSQWRRGGRAVRLAELERPRAVLELLALRVDGTPSPWLAPLLEVEPQGLLDEAAGEPLLGGSTPGASTWPDRALEDPVVTAVGVLAAHLPPPQDDVVLQADGSAVVAGRPSQGLRALLDQLGSRESDHTWRLRAEDVRQALDAGASGAGLLAELRERSRHDLPPVVEQLVLDVARGHGRIRVTATTSVLRLDDPVLAAELLHDRRLLPLALTEIAPGVLATTAEPVDLVLALRAAGHAPVGDGAAPPPPPEPPRVRTARPVVQQRAWGHAPEQVIAALRAAPSRPPEPVTPAPRLGEVGSTVGPDLRGPDTRLSQLTEDERLLLQHAMLSGGPVELDYLDTAGMPTTRVVEQLLDTGSLFEGWCRRRGDERSFVPAGIISVRSFQHRPGPAG